MSLLRYGLVIVATSLVACGAATGIGSDVTPGQDASSTGASSVDASPVDASALDSGPPRADASTPPCPAEMPVVGSACSRPYFACEYGASPLLACDSLVACEDGTWTMQPARDDQGACEPPLAPACPATRAEVDRTSPCEVVGDCTYADGSCQCVLPGSEEDYPDSGAASGLLGEWVCVDPACPFPRPRIGDACSTPNQNCYYVVCGYAEYCTVDGYWMYADVYC
jgi:hypothetical protein